MVPPSGAVSAERALVLLGTPTSGNIPVGGFPSLACRPEEVVPGALYFGFPEFLRYNRWQEGGGAELCAEAIARGAAGAVLDKLPSNTGGFPVQWVIPEARRIFAELARQAYGCPDEAMELIGVTGTNGKTTTTALIGHLDSISEKPAGWMGTLGCYAGARLVDAMDYTTDMAHQSMRRLQLLRDRGVGLLAMEVSSHGLALNRVEGFRFRAAVLTNVTQDHLDFHGDGEAYLRAKIRLFEQLDSNAVAVLNRGDARWKDFASATRAQVLTYSAGLPDADLVAREIEVSAGSVSFTFQWEGHTHRLATSLTGRFQVENLLAAVGVLLALGRSPERLCAAAASFRSVLGRMESIPLPGGAAAIIDYAHNPAGLEQLLSACRALGPRRLILVFGCGGDRDRSKRPMMGRIAEEAADCVFVTADNPRTESVQAILDEILGGFRTPAQAVVIHSREEAIVAACDCAASGDLVVIAGKGHEDYQILGTKKVFFSDHAVVQSWIRSR